MRNIHFLHVLGSGSFGTVYLADLSSSQGFRRHVAVKVLLQDGPGQDELVSRIRDEARLLGLLQDDAILNVLDMVRVNNRDAVVMEYIEGVNLNEILEQGFVLPPRVIAEIGSCIAGALGRAHTAQHPQDMTPLNVIHRDVKPANIMITPRGGVKLLDFGVAKAKFETRESRTAGPMVLGTLNYMAPEYIVYSDVSPALDVYGLALTLWTMASNQSFGKPKIDEDAHNARRDQRIQSIRETHPRMADLLHQMLDWDPALRPDARQAELRLQQIADDLQGTGLRSWAAQNIPGLLKSRKPSQDVVGLLGKRIEIQNQQKTSPESVLRINTPDRIHDFPLHENHVQDTVKPDLSASSGPSPFPSPSPSKPPPQPLHANRVLIVILQGIIVGGLFGFLTVVLLIALFVLR